MLTGHTPVCNNSYHNFSEFKRNWYRKKPDTAPSKIETENYSAQRIVFKYYKYIKSEVFFLLKRSTFEKDGHAVVGQLTNVYIQVNKFVENLYTRN